MERRRVGAAHRGPRGFDLDRLRASLPRAKARRAFAGFRGSRFSTGGALDPETQSRAEDNPQGRSWIMDKKKSQGLGALVSGLAATHVELWHEEDKARLPNDAQVA